MQVEVAYLAVAMHTIQTTGTALTFRFDKADYGNFSVDKLEPIAPVCAQVSLLQLCTFELVLAKSIKA